MKDTLGSSLSTSNTMYPSLTYVTSTASSRIARVSFQPFKEANTFLETITQGDFKKCQDKVATVRNPTLRFIFKFVSNTFFARKDTGSVNKNELNMVFHGVKHIINKPNGEYFDRRFGSDVNLGCVFAKHLLTFTANGQRTQQNHNFG
ncbi:unnamed protein product [Cochlearia groenlandica]